MGFLDIILCCMNTDTVIVKHTTTIKGDEHFQIGRKSNHPCSEYTYKYKKNDTNMAGHKFGSGVSW